MANRSSGRAELKSKKIHHKDTKDTNPKGSKLSTHFVLVLLALGVCILLYWNFAVATEQHFVYLSQSFLHGSLHFLTPAGGVWDDTSVYEGNHFWPLGPLPAIVLMPFVLVFGLLMRQGYILFFLNLTCLVLVYRIALRITNNSATSLWLCFGYVFSSAFLFIAMVSWSWYFAQAISSTLLLLSIHEYLGRKRFWLIGILLGLAVATRANLLFALPFFLYTGDDKRAKWVNAAKLVAPVGVSLLLLLCYNFFRFNDPLEFGYRYQLIRDELLINRAHGMWSFIHFPANLYYFLLKGPGTVFLPGSKILTYPFIYPDPWGMSILFTSPLFLWMFRASLRESIVQRAAGTSLVMLFVLFGYYGIGVRQYGYRYALDVYPFLLLILCYALREGMTTYMKAVMTASAAWNAVLIPLVFRRWS